MSKVEYIELHNINCIRFVGSGKITINSLGYVEGASSHTVKNNTVTFECGAGVGGGVTITNSFGGIGNSFSGSVSSFSGGSMSVSDGIVQWGSSVSVQKTSTGLKVNMPETSILSLNGKRFRVSALMSGDTVTADDLPQEKEKKYHIATGDVKKIIVEGGCKLLLKRFGRLSAAHLDITATSNADVKLDKDFAVEELRVTTSGNSMLTSVSCGAIRNATLNASGNSSQRSLNILGTLDATSSGNSSIRVGVADKNKVNDAVSGNATCKVYRIDDETILETTKILSMLASGSARTPFSSSIALEKETDEDDSDSSSSSSESSDESSKGASKKRSRHVTKTADKGKKAKHE